MKPIPRLPSHRRLAVCALFSTLFGVSSPGEASPGEASRRVPTARNAEKGQPFPSLREAIDSGRYAIRPRENDPDRAGAGNPEHNFRADLTSAGFSLSAPTPQGKVYRSHWKLTTMGYGERTRAVSEGTLKTCGQRAEILRPDDRTTEWFVNSRDGFEHGFVLARRPDFSSGGNPLVLSIHVNGDLLPGSGGDGKSIKLTDPATGRTILNYGDLKAWDADGRTIPARLACEGRTVTFRVDDRQARYPLTIDPTFTREGYLKASNAEGNDYFGYSVSVSGNLAVVGAFQESGDAASTGSSPNNNAPSAGAAYVFRRDNSGNWSEEAYLKASNAEGGDEFGYSVAIDGDTVVVGAQEEAGDASSTASVPNNNAGGAGAAYVFVRDSGGNWTQQAYLKAANAGGGDNFGVSVSVSGDLIVVGAKDEAGDASSTALSPNDNAGRAGAAYTFRRDTMGQWSQEAYLKASNAGANDYFGISVSISGDTAVVGANGESGDAMSTVAMPNDNAGSAGAAYVFVRDSGGNWSQQAYLKAGNAGSGDWLGYSVSVSGDRALAGAALERGDASSTGLSPNDNASSAGAVYAFVRDGGGNWTQEAYLKSSTSPSSGRFGYSVSLDGDRAVVSAYGEQPVGAIYPFLRSVGGVWTEDARLVGANAEGNDRFGLSVAISGPTILAGAYLEGGDASSTLDMPNNDAGGAGAAYLFEEEIAPDNTAAIRTLRRKISKTKRQLRRAKKKGDRRKVRQLKRKLNRFKRQLRRL